MKQTSAFVWIVILCSLCACSANPGSPSVSGPMSQRMLTSVARWAPGWHPDRRNSWISLEVKRKAKPLLFVSDASAADVYIYSLPSLKLTGTITGFSQPQGECSDNKGNVWVTDANAQTIYELTHHGYLENELSDTSGYPVGCAWDSTTGNLAVMDLFGTGSTSGSVLVYSKGSGSPTSYTNSAQYSYYFGGYDRSGNLFFDGLDNGGNFMLSELPARASSAHTVKLSGGTIYFPGMVQWDSTRAGLVIGDQSCGNTYSSCLYQVTISEQAGKIGKQILLEGSSGTPLCDLVQGTLFGTRNTELAGSDLEFCGSAPSGTYVWPYPGGGAAADANSSTDSAPVGAAISR
jgi:hypothetical protein